MRSFIPSNSSVPPSPWKTVQLSQRDLSLQIPINFVTQPAVSLSAACFGKKVYDEEAAKRCISNLLSVGYRRLHIDIYWAAEKRKWTLCPVTIPVGGLGSAFTSSAPSPSGTSSPQPPKGLPGNGSHVFASMTDLPTIKGPYGTSLYQLGPNFCSENVDLKNLIQIMADYYSSTEDTLSAHLTYMTFDLHATASIDAPDGPPQAPKASQLPSSSEALGNILNRALEKYLYTSSELDSERKDLNKTWFSQGPWLRTIPQYFMIDQIGSRLQTPNGWPGEGAVEIAKAQRLLVGWGAVDPQMEAYNFSFDRDVLFSTGSLASLVKASEGRNDSLNVECLYKANTTDVNSDESWALTELPAANSVTQFSHFTSQLVSCGISPFVNHTLFNVTADQDVEPYRNISASSVWSWAPGEPKSPADSEAPDANRCSMMDLRLDGRWRSSGCSDRLFAACRIDDSPFNWTLSTERGSYALAESLCPGNSAFSVPRTALENTYLYKYVLGLPNDYFEPSEKHEYRRSIWIDFNSFDVPTCWVTGGPKAQCPYEIDEGAIRRRSILVPSIAAIIILILTALTLFVKCNANRRNSRRRRVIEGWEYEGVPS